MNNKKIHCYLASGWFSPNQDEVLTKIEDLLRMCPEVSPYFPRHDGVKLKENEFHDSNLRRKIFEDNVSHIEESDFVIAAVDGRDGFYDTGTMWEIGYAMDKDIPVVAFDTTNNINENLAGIRNKFAFICHDYVSLEFVIKGLSEEILKPRQNKIPMKILFIGPDTTEEQRETNSDIISSVILECHGSNFRWIDNLTCPTLADSMDKILDSIDYVIAVIDDRHPIVSWVMGRAYSRDIPVITYTNFDFGVNIMLLCSLLYHCKGKEELKAVMQKMRREGIYSLPKFDDSNTKAM